MKKLFLIPLGIALLVATLLLTHRRLSTPETSSRHATLAQAEKNTAQTTPDHPAQPAPGQTTPVATSAPAENPDAMLARIPEGTFRTSLLQLGQPARLRALKKLMHIQVPKEDYSSLHVTAEGDLFYACLYPAIPPVELTSDDKASIAAAPATGEASVPISTPPARHSRPGATNVLYLDFNGHTVTGTAWNTNNGVALYQARPYDTDGDPATFSDTEQAAIIQIWERVAEDYATFNVDVTTEEPSSFTQTTGRALITRSIDANGVNMPSSTAGGVAFIDVFNNASYVTRYSPAFIYYNNLAGGTVPSVIAEAAAHELGHNLGLSHDGQNNGTEYYGGHGNGEISWGPIMGTGYSRNVSQWSKGEYSLANNLEDDIAVIAAYLGRIPDAVSDTTSSATTITPSGGVFSATGVINSSSDRDVYSIQMGSGPVSLSATGYRAVGSSINVNDSNTDGGNTDLKLELLDGAGSPLATSDPAASTTASLTYSIPATGLYYIRISSVGAGSPSAPTPTGYTSYGSVGQYTLSGTGIVESGGITRNVTNVGELTSAITAANASSSATYTINLAGGTYTLSTALPQLAATQITLVGPAYGTRAVIDANALSSGVIFDITTDQVLIKNITFRNARTHAITIQSGADQGIIQDCTFDYPTAPATITSAIYGTACTGWTVTGNSFSNIAGDTATAEPAIWFLNGASGTIIANNLVLNCDQGIALGSGPFSTHVGGVIRNNMIADNRTATGFPGAGITLDSVSGGVQVDNNTLYLAGSYANAIECRYAGTSGALVRNNLANKAIVTLYSATATQTGNNLSAIPAWFVAPASCDLHLTSTATTVINSATTGVTTDIDGDARPIGSGYETGADEYQPDNIAPSIPTGLTATANSSTQITLSWSASTDTAPSGVTASGVGEYRIYRAGVLIGVSTATTYVDTGLTAATAYSYTVAASDNAHNLSAQSTSASATTLSPAPGTPDNHIPLETLTGPGGGAPGLLYFAALVVLGMLRSVHRLRR